MKLFFVILIKMISNFLEVKGAFSCDTLQKFFIIDYCLFTKNVLSEHVVSEYIYITVTCISHHF